MPKRQSVKLDRYTPTLSASVDTSALTRTHALADFQSEDELAEELDRNSRTLARWRAAGIGPPYVVIGRRILYRRASVAEWLRRRERGGFEQRNGRGWAGKRGA
jgi:hypothetical protein